VTCRLCDCLYSRWLAGFVIVCTHSDLQAVWLHSQWPAGFVIVCTHSDLQAVWLSALTVTCRLCDCTHSDLQAFWLSALTVTCRLHKGNSLEESQRVSCFVRYGTMNGMKPACKGTAKDRNFSVAGRFRLIQILEVWIIEAPYPRKCKIFSIKTGSVCCFSCNERL
jgi:hypothetical protein